MQPLITSGQKGLLKEWEDIYFFSDGTMYRENCTVQIRFFDGFNETWICASIEESRSLFFTLIKKYHNEDF